MSASVPVGGRELVVARPDEAFLDGVTKADLVACCAASPGRARSRLAELLAGRA